MRLMRKVISQVWIIQFRVAFILLFSAAGMAQSMPTPSSHFARWPARTWIDLDTGHRVFRLSDQPNSRGLYFNENAFTPDHLDMIYRSHDGIFLLNLAKRTTKLVVRGETRDIIVGTKTRRVFFMKVGDQHVYVSNIDTQQVMQLGELPARADVSTLNADETLLAGAYLEGSGPDLEELRKANTLSETIKSEPRADEAEKRRRKAEAVETRWASHLPQMLFTMDLRSGHVNTILHSNDWLNHVLFSPTDPTLLMYCHEGPSLKVDRIWTVRSDGTQNKLMHVRTNPSESVTHEFWSQDGKTIWYDLQVGKRQEFAVAGVDVETGKRTVFHLEKTDSSRHFNSTSNNSIFCADGNSDAHGDLGEQKHVTLKRQWIQLLRPALNEGADVSHSSAVSLSSEHLVNLSKHNYMSLEPNVRFSPDNSLVIFTSNMYGPSYLFAVEVAKAQ